nr:G protein-coupled receptor [Proales similis]
MQRPPHHWFTRSIAAVWRELGSGLTLGRQLILYFGVVFFTSRSALGSSNHSDAVAAYFNSDPNSQAYVSMFNKSSSEGLELGASQDGFVDTQDAQVAEQGNDEIYSFTAKVILSTLATSASLITVFGNSLVMLSFLFDRQIRNPTNYFILSLSVSDFLIGCISMPFLTLYLMLGKWPFGQIICNLWLSLDYTVCLTSIYTVLFITIDRFCSVKIPTKYRKWRTPRKIIIMIALTWIVPISLFFPSIFGWAYISDVPFSPYNCDVAWSSNQVFSVLLVIGYFWITLAIIITLYVFIYRVALNLEKKSREKQRKLSSLVGCSATNTGALVGAVALPPNLTTAVSRMNTESSTKSPENDDDDDDDNSDSSQSKLGKLKKKAFFFRRGKKKHARQNEEEKPAISNGEAKTHASNHHKQHGTQEKSKATSNNLLKVNFGPNYKSLNQKKNISQSLSRTSSRMDEYSSSYESHSEAHEKRTPESQKKLKHQQANTSTGGRSSDQAKSGESSPGKVARPQTLDIPKSKALNQTQSEANFEAAVAATAAVTKEVSAAIEAISNPSDEQPSRQLNNAAENEAAARSSRQASIKSNKIPFIDDEQDELSYVLHRRQINSQNRMPIKEETILIKSNLVTGFFQKISSPMKSLSRRGSQRSGTDVEAQTSKFETLYSRSFKRSSPAATTNETQRPETGTDQSRKMSTQVAADSKPVDDRRPLLDQNEAKQSVEANQTSMEITAVTVKSSNTMTTTSVSPRLTFKPNPIDNKPPVVTSRPPVVRHQKRKKYDNRARKALRTITFILGAFILCFAPWHVVSVYNSFCKSCFDSHAYHHFFYSAYYLCYMNSPINPFMYALANQQFKKTFYRILKFDWRRM